MSAKVFVGNLNFKTTQSELEELFAEAGEVVEVFIPMDRATGRPRGFAFVTFAQPAEAAEAIKKFDGHEVGGRQLRINEAQERRPRPPSFDGSSSFSSFGNRGGGHGGGGGGHGGGAPPSRPKGSRRNLRGKKRSL